MALNDGRWAFAITADRRKESYFTIIDIFSDTPQKDN